MAVDPFPSQLYLKIELEPVKCGDGRVCGNDAGGMLEDALGTAFAFGALQHFTRITTGRAAAVFRDAFDHRLRKNAYEDRNRR